MRVVAPIVGAFPVFSIAAAIATGAEISFSQILAVLLIVAGIAAVARTPTTHSHQSSQSQAQSQDTHSLAYPMGWAFISALAFASTFGFGQAASNESAPLVSILLTRTIATIGCAVLLMWVSLNREQQPFFPPIRSLPLLLVMGLLDSVALGLVLVAGSMEHAEFAAVASSVFGLVTILIAWIFLKEQIDKLQFWVSS